MGMGPNKFDVLASQSVQNMQIFRTIFEKTRIVARRPYETLQLTLRLRKRKCFYGLSFLYVRANATSTYSKTQIFGLFGAIIAFVWLCLQASFL